MAKITIDKNRCKGCFLCISVCPKGALTKEEQLNKHGVTAVTMKEHADCLGCALCAVICPDCCIEVYKEG